MDTSPREQTAQLRMQEHITGSAAVGVSQVDFLGYPDAQPTQQLTRRARSATDPLGADNRGSRNDALVQHRAQTIGPRP